MKNRSLWLAVALCATLTTCTDRRDLTAPDSKDPVIPPGATALLCEASRLTERVTCRTPTPVGASGSSAQSAIILGGQNVFVRLVGTNAVYNSGTEEFTFDVTVQNLIPQSLGTSDGTTVDGVQVFFYTGPTAATGTGTITVEDALTGTFTSAGQKYYEYAEILGTDETSASKQWKLKMPPTVLTFTFSVFVNAEVQYPQGWIDVSPDNFNTAIGGTQQLTAGVRDMVGREQVGETVTWSSTDTDVATVNSSGLVTGVARGSVTINATSPGPGATTRTGSVTGTIGEKPSATADAYDAAFNTTLTVPTTGVLTNDDRGLPVGNVLSFGGGSLGGTAGSNAAGTTVTPLPSAASGSLTVNADGSLSFTPATGFAGDYTFDYVVSNTHGTDTATVTITVHGPPEVQSTTPAAAATVAANQAITVVFNKAVTITASAFTLECPAATGIPITVDPAVPGGVTSYTLTPNANLPSGNCVLTVDKDEVTEVGGAGQNMLADHTLNFSVDAAPTVSSTTPTNSATGIAPSATISVTFSEQVNATTSSFEIKCPASGSVRPFALSASPATTFTLTPNDALAAGTVCQVRVIAAQVTDTDAFDPPNTMESDYTFSFTTTITLTNDLFPETILGNVKVNSANGTPFSATTNDQIGATATITFAGWEGTPGVTEQGGTISMTTSGADIGKFIYNPPAGYEGVDKFRYDVDSEGATGNALVSLPVSGMIWFVNSGADACTSVAAGCGRFETPFSSLAALQAVNNGTGNNPAAGDNIFLYGGTTHVGPLTLLANQRVIGQNASASLITIAGVTPPSGSPALPVMGTGTTVAGANGITLASGNTVRGMSLAPTAGIALSGTSFGTLTISADLSIASTGQALSLTTGTLSGSLGGLASSGGTNNVLLSGVATSGTSTLGAGGNALTGASGNGVEITGGAGSFTFPGNITNAASFAVNVNSKTGGTVTFSGNVNPAGAARGVSVTNNNSGSNTIVFSGTTKQISSGTAAGVMLSSNTGATIQFTGGGLTIATTTGTPFTAMGGGTIEVTGSGNTISATGAAVNAVNLNGITLGAAGVTFSSIGSSGTTTGSAFSATSVGNTSGSSFTAGSLTVAGTTGGTSRGLALTTNSAPFTFTTASINGTGAQGIYLDSNTGAVAVNGGSVGNTTSTTGDALFVTGGNATVAVAASLTKSSTGRIANIASHTAGTVTVSGTLSCSGSCTGVLVNANGANVDFTAGTKTINTGGNAAVTLTSNTGTINFTNGGLAITTTSGAGFSASGGGTVNVTTGGNHNTVSSGTGTAVTINGTIIGSSSVTFRSITHAGGANGIFLKDTGTSGGSFTVTGDGSTNSSGGTITNTTGGDGATSGIGIYLNNTRNISLNWMGLSGHSNHGLFGTGVRGNLTIDKLRFTGTNGTSNSGTFSESSISLGNHGGTTRITRSRIDGGAYNALVVGNSAGTSPALDSLVIENDTIESMQGTTADVRSSAILVSLMDGTANTRIMNNRVTVWWGNAIHVLVQGTASGTAKIQNNFADNTNGALAGAGGIWVAGCNFAFNISSNTVRNTNGTAISADKANCAGTTFQGTINGNTIGVSGVANSGSGTGIGIFASGRNGTTIVKISNNILRQINGSANGAITTQVGDAAAFSPAGTMNATISGNNVQESGTTVNNAQHGILVTHGTLTGDSHVGCYDVLSNTIINFTNGTANNRMRVNQRFSTTSRWPGYTGAALGVTSQTDMASYLLGRNTASTSTNANTSTVGFLNTSPAGSACTQPSM